MKILWKNFLENKKIFEDELKSAIRFATLKVKFFPVLVGSAFKNKGIQLLLDAVIDYLPSPLDINVISGIENKKNNKKILRKANDIEPFSALAFKVMTDSFVGKLTFFRVYSGVLESGSYIFNSTKNKKERIGRILQMHANMRKEIKKVYSGDIAAAIGLKDTTTGDTLCSIDFPVILENIQIPKPVIQIAIIPKTQIDQDRMSFAIRKLMDEDPSFYVETNPETGETIMSGMGELHLDILVNRNVI